MFEKKRSFSSLVALALIPLAMSMAAQAQTSPPSSGYLTDSPDFKSKAIKFAGGDLRHFPSYELFVEGVPNTAPELNLEKNLIIIPEHDYPAWNSDIRVYGVTAAGVDQKLFEQKGEIRPSAGYVNKDDTRRIKFENGSVNRFQKYLVLNNGQAIRDIKADEKTNELVLVTPLSRGATVEVFGLNDADKRVPLWSGKVPGGTTPVPTLPTNGWVEFHDRATCILFNKGDLTAYAASYELHYEGQVTRDYRGLAPTHIRFENIGHHVRTRVQLYAISKTGEKTLLFDGKIRD
jgi:hypothetical protein